MKKLFLLLLPLFVMLTGCVPAELKLRQMPTENPSAPVVIAAFLISRHTRIFKSNGRIVPCFTQRCHIVVVNPAQIFAPCAFSGGTVIFTSCHITVKRKKLSVRAADKVDAADDFSLRRFFKMFDHSGNGFS